VIADVGIAHVRDSGSRPAERDPEAKPKVRECRRAAAGSQALPHAGGQSRRYTVAISELWPRPKSAAELDEMRVAPISLARASSGAYKLPRV